MYQFTPPTVDRRFSNDYRDFLWNRLSYKEGVTVVKTTAGAYRQEQFHDTNATDIAVVYPGGHVSTVSDAEAASLTTAGYGAFLKQVL